MRILILTICFSCFLFVPSFSQTQNEWQVSFGLNPFEQIFMRALIDGVKPTNPNQPDGFLPIGNFIVSRNSTQNRFTFMFESFSGFMHVKSKEVSTQQITSTNSINSGLLFGGRYCWNSGKVKVYSGVHIGGQLLYIWENKNNERSWVRVPAFHIEAIHFRFGANNNWGVGLGVGSKGILNFAWTLPSH